MSTMPEPVRSEASHKHGSPTRHIIGFILSIVLSIVALELVLHHSMPKGAVLGFIVLLAVVQIFVQLFMFMHITESYGPAYHTLMLMIGFFFVIAIVGGSIWVMSFNAQVS